MRQADLDLFGKSDFFQHLPDRYAATLARGALVRHLPKDAVLWRAGAPVVFMHVVLSGRLAIVGRNNDSLPAIIDVFGPGEVIGLSAAFSAQTVAKARFTFSCIAVEETRVMLLRPAAMRRHILADHKVAITVSRLLAQKIIRLYAVVRDLKELSANQRLAAYLLSLTPKRRGSATLRLTADQQFLAGTIGVTRESLSRSFAQLRPHGVSKRGRVVILADIAALRRLCAPKSTAA